jgi:hypothetical protein
MPPCAFVSLCTYPSNTYPSNWIKFCHFNIKNIDCVVLVIRLSSQWHVCDRCTVLFILISTRVNWNISKVIQDNWMQISTWYQESCCAYIQRVAEIMASSHRIVIDRFLKVQKSPCRKLDIFGKTSQLIGGEQNSKNSDVCFIKIRWPSI